MRLRTWRTLLNRGRCILLPTQRGPALELVVVPNKPGRVRGVLEQILGEILQRMSQWWLKARETGAHTFCRILYFPAKASLMRSLSACSSWNLALQSGGDDTRSRENAVM